MTDHTPGDAERPSPRNDLSGYLEHFERRMTSLQERASDSKARLAEVSASASSDNGEVTVTVTGGALSSVDFGPEMRRTSPQTMSEMVMDCYRRAAEEARSKADEIMSELLDGGAGGSR